MRNRTRVLDAAVSVFSEEGVGASTETIAARASVGVGTVFRHFPTKTELLEAVLSRMFDDLTNATTAALSMGDPGSAFFAVLERVIDQAATKKAIADALGGAGIDIHRRAFIGGFKEAMSSLLASAQAAGAVRPDIGIDEVIAVIVAASRAAEYAGTDTRLRRRSIGVVFDGLRPIS